MLLLAAVALLISSIAFHEMGHWLVLKKLGVPVKAVSLGAGPAILSGQNWALRLFPVAVSLHFSPAAWKRLSPEARFYAAVAGPVANLLLAFVLAAAGALEGSEGLLLLAKLNVWLAALNLLPIPPFDGWQALIAASERWTGSAIPSRFESVASRLGNAFVFSIGALVLVQLVSGAWLTEFNP